MVCAFFVCVRVCWGGWVLSLISPSFGFPHSQTLIRELTWKYLVFADFIWLKLSLVFICFPEVVFFS